VAIVIVLAVLATVVVLVASGGPGGRFPRRRDREGHNRDPWHGDPRPHVVDRPAGADAEDMGPGTGSEP
jgi:hypothetical protein